MPTVETEVIIHAAVDAVYAVARDNEAFPDFMEDVKSVTLVERDGERVVCDWVGVVPTFGLKVRWRQEDFWNPAGRECKFRQIEGDYDSLSGLWRFHEVEGGTRFESRLDYEYNVPGLGPLVGRVVHSLVVKNMEGVLGAIKKRAESKAAPGD